LKFFRQNNYTEKAEILYFLNLVYFLSLVGLWQNHVLYWPLTDFMWRSRTPFEKRVVNKYRSVTWNLKLALTDKIPIKGNFRFGFKFMVFNATFNNISVISWWSVLLVGETGVPEENHRPVANHWQTLSHIVVSSLILRFTLRTINFTFAFTVLGLIISLFYCRMCCTYYHS
jgi:hypothetical protein